MAYKIAVASSDGEKIDLSFGKAQAFLIFQVNGRKIEQCLIRRSAPSSEKAAAGCTSKNKEGCCGGGGKHDANAELIADCRCILCKAIGPQARRALERRSISIFDLEADVKSALEKVVSYFDRVDRHQNAVIK